MTLELCHLPTLAQASLRVTVTLVGPDVSSPEMRAHKYARLYKRWFVVHAVSRPETWAHRHARLYKRRMRAHDISPPEMWTQRSWFLSDNEAASHFADFDPVAENSLKANLDRILRCLRPYSRPWQHERMIDFSASSYQID